MESALVFRSLVRVAWFVLWYVVNVAQVVLLLKLDARITFSLVEHLGVVFMHMYLFGRSMTSSAQGHLNCASCVQHKQYQLGMYSTCARLLEGLCYSKHVSETWRRGDRSSSSLPLNQRRSAKINQSNLDRPTAVSSENRLLKNNNASVSAQKGRLKISTIIGRTRRCFRRKLGRKWLNSVFARWVPLGGEQAWRGSWLLQLLWSLRRSYLRWPEQLRQGQAIHVRHSTTAQSRCDLRKDERSAYPQFIHLVAVRDGWLVVAYGMVHFTVSWARGTMCVLILDKAGESLMTTNFQDTRGTDGYAYCCCMIAFGLFADFFQPQQVTGCTRVPSHVLKVSNDLGTIPRWSRRQGKF